MYAIFNMNPLIFSQQRTWETRIFSGTFNFTKISSYLFLCVAFVKYAERNTEAIISGNVKPRLNDILMGFSNAFGQLAYEDTVGRELADYLIAHFDWRKKEILKCSKHEDYLAKTVEWGEVDRNYKFEFGDLKTIY